MSYKRFAMKNFAQVTAPVIRVLTFAAIIVFAGALIVDGAHPSHAEARTVAGKASGSLTIDGKSIPLKYSYAMAQPNTFDKDKTDIAVLLTEGPLAEDALNNAEELQDAARKLHGWVLFKIDDQGKPIYEVIDHPAIGEERLMMSGFTHAKFTPKKIGKDNVGGSFFTGKAEDFMNHKYEVKADFSAPLLQAKRPEPLPDAKTGKALPGDGGDPGKAYRAYLKAIRDKDITGLRSMATNVQSQSATDEDLRQMIELMAIMTPADPKITRGFVKGDRAVLYLEGTLEGEKRYGTVQFAKEKKMWRIEKEGWSNTPPKK